MNLRPLLSTGFFAFTLLLAACGGDTEAPPADVNLADINERSITDQAAYLDAYRLGEQIKQQDSTFNLDLFLQGLRAGYERDSAEAVPYALGYQRGIELQIQGRQDSTLTMDIGVYASAIREAFRGDSIRLTPRQEREVQEQLQLTSIQRDALTNPQAAGFLERVETNRASADSFLTANSQREGIQTTPSGLQYEVLASGSGESPSVGDRILMTYTLSLPDGTELQRSDQPLDFEIGDGLIEGMTETLTGMQIGERRRVYIPPALGYGTLGEPRAGIGPNTVIVFEVQLVDILDPVADPAAGAPTGDGTAAPATPPAPPQGQ